MRDTKGISLIALVITIIILLILSAVTINMVFGDSSIISKANLAKDKTNQANDDEMEKLEVLENQLEISTNRQDSSQKTKIIFNSKTDPQGAIVNAGYTDGSSERTFTDDVNNYDFLLVYMGNSLEELFGPTLIHKFHFGEKNIFLNVGGLTANASSSIGTIQIDQENNRIIFQSKAHTVLQINQVIGVKL